MVIHVYLSILQASGCDPPLLTAFAKSYILKFLLQKSTIHTFARNFRWETLRWNILGVRHIEKYAAVWAGGHTVPSRYGHVCIFIHINSRHGPQMPHIFARIFWWETARLSVFGVRLFAAGHLYSYRRKVCQPLRPAYKNYTVSKLYRKDPQ